MLTAVGLGTRVRALRQALGLSQERLARDANVSHSTVWNIEVGRKMPDLATALAIARALRVTLNDLVLEEETSVNVNPQEKPPGNNRARREDRAVQIRPRRAARATPAPPGRRGRLSAG